ncbi:MAG: hypothetical protein AB7G21_08860 [Dehalococcoidia bacterium]
MATHAPSSSPLRLRDGVRGLRVPGAVAMSLLVAAALAVAVLAWMPRGPGAGVLATPDAGWIVANDDGSVLARVPGEADRVLLPPWSERPSPDVLFPGARLSSREVAFDPVRRLLWYSDSHSAIRSVFVDTGEAGPYLLGFADLSAPGCGLTSDARHMAIDLKHRRLVVPTLTGNVLFYSLDDVTMVGGLGVAFFGDVVYGGFRHFAVDPATGLAWYATATGDLVEADLVRGTRTGRIVPLARQDGGAPNAYRVMAIDAARRQLVYRTKDGRLAGFDLRTLAPVSDLSLADAPEAYTYLGAAAR